MLCPETMHPLIVLAQVDVTSEVQAQHRLAVLQVRKACT